MALNEILTKIKEIQPLADERVEDGPPETARARAGRKAQSIESLKRLRREYSTDLLKTAAFIMVIGSQRNEFTELALESKCFQADPEEFYRDLANRVPESLYLGRESVSNLFDILGRHLEDKMIEFDRVYGYPQLIFKQEYQRTVHNRAEFLGLVKQALLDQIGGEIVAIQSIQTLTGEAITRGHTARFTPILLPSGDNKFALRVAKDLERVSDRVFVIVAGEGPSPSQNEYDVVRIPEVDSSHVKKTLVSISKQLKNNK